MELSGWARYPRARCRVVRPRTEQDVRTALAEGPVIARGMGRAYGDSALGPGATLDMRGFDRMLGFDARSGVLTAEAGVLLSDVIACFLPRGWFPAVTPGTKHVTIGGMIAADVHGKNHHLDGSAGEKVDWLDLMTADGAVLRCSPTENSALFDWTLGGMGLTGIVLRAAVRLRPVETGWMRQRTVRAASLDAAMAVFEAENDATYSVAWIDCLARGAQLGRSLVFLGEHARLDELDAARRAQCFPPARRRRASIPVDMPSWALGGMSLRVFNELHYRRGGTRLADALVHWDDYFFPLDAIGSWNRLYGRRGFVQYQCVLPMATARSGLHALLEAISAAGGGSFLAVLKRFGTGRGGLSFAMEGYTLALDFPVNARTLALFDQLDVITLAHEGRFYLAKDARLTAETFACSDARASAFRAMRRETGSERRFVSIQSKRLAL